jgi:enterochelin esterase-like enzyme
LLLAGILGSFAARAGEVVNVDFAAAALNRDMHYSVYLPDGYTDAKQNYPVLYLLHGYGEDAEEWLVKGQLVALIDGLTAAGDIPPCLVVMPSVGNSWYIDRQEKMETAIIQDLIPDVDRRFHTIARRNGRVIGGESMGGYGALRFVLKYPELFQAAALLSPAIYVPLPPKDSGARRSAAFQTDGAFDPAIWTAHNYPSLIPGFLAKHIELPLYLGVGSQDQFDIDIHMAKLWMKWLQHGWSARWRLVVGRHDFVLWRKLAPAALTFIFKTVSAPEAHLTQPVTEIGGARTPG